MESDLDIKIESATNELNEEINNSSSFIKLFITIFLIILVIVILNSSFFDVQEIIVTNNNTLSQEEIIMFSGIRRGQSTYRINKEQITELLKENPLIGNAEVSVKFPNKLIINVIERTPRCLIPYRGNYLVVATDKVVIRAVPNRDSIKLPLVIGLNPEEPLLGLPITGNKIDEVIAILNLLDKKLYSLLLQIDIENYLMYIKNQATAEIIKVELGNMQEIGRKITNLRSILAQMNLEAIQTIDIRKPHLPTIIKR
ncbi:MAG TPA: FtsQ-type POTRA domain-containing protein [Bacillota bacterium]|nr:FtsQ-type POTRA domain-containing protein [Bacillota bacterium]HOL10039.1 FtsQ-type POTRA domain-containing protein [Bacillota bacterium]HPO97789.1 FtsQ-type POTRA domain-containing protein [Bacillota bacterium]